ncbi:heterokaryon incompatibility protein-domain-containing protein, partial [Rhexocercosporidium sp. MPI-PUGE-AT-0058]
CQVSSFLQSGCLLPLISILRSPQPDSKQHVQCSLVDFGILRDWIASCQTSHSLPQCRGSHLSQFTTPIRVIDCQTRKVILAPKDCKYIALSYVWGVAGSSHETVNGNDIPALPRTIRDSITVTTSMGYRYLWVDKYCIKQDENSDLLAQVQQMDLIYRQAQATIIACAGSSPDSGLPGVSTPRTIVQARVTVGHLPLVTFRLFPWVEPNSSKWQTRGWTFQEHLLSSRRLFFTDEQVLFACNEFWASEMFRHPQKLELSLRTYPGSSSIWKPKSGLSGVQPMAHWRGNGSLPTLLQYIEEYSKRELTKPNDIFNAFHGILKAFMAINPSISHLWGIPFSGEQVDSLNSFCHCLLWENRCMLRREGFPSWSWVGWLGAAA